jgi:peroxiredoxin
VVAFLLAAAGAWLFLGRQEKPLGPVDESGLAPADTGRVRVGDGAPDFTLLSREGSRVTLSAFRGHKNVVLVFYRGLGCEECVPRLAELSHLLDGKLRSTTEVVAVSVDPPDMLDAMVTRITGEEGRAPDYLFLSDPDHRVIDRYGLFDPEGASPGPRPTVIVVDRDGLVRWRSIGSEARPVRGSIAEMLEIR